MYADHLDLNVLTHPFPTLRSSDLDGVEDIKDLRPGMVLEGVVSNVAAFGAFVDIGVHQDGLVHISALADRYVKDPREVVKAGDIVKVKRSEEHTSELQSLMRISYAVFCLKKKK